jgi:RNA 2',3'-cyclic 3'-phosphodiesterase
MFVALDLPADARQAVATWRDELLAGRSELRPVPLDHLHVTLAFLGWQDEATASAIAAAAFGAVADGVAPPRLRAAGVEPVPPRGPRLFALDLEDEGARCGELQAAVSGALERERVYRPEKRPFWPHVTLARVKRGARAAPPGELAPPPDWFEAAELTLYRSTLRPQGALYEPLARLRLDDG